MEHWKAEIDFAPSLDKNLDNLVRKMLAGRPRDNRSIARPNGNGKIVPAGALPKRELVCIFPANLALVPQDGKLGDEMTHSVGKALSLKSTAEGIDWRFKIVALKKPAKRRRARQPHLHAGREFKSFSKKLTLLG